MALRAEPIFLFFLFAYLFLAALGLQCYTAFSLVAANGGYSAVAMQWLLLLQNMGSRPHRLQ